MTNIGQLSKQSFTVGDLTVDFVKEMVEITHELPPCEPFNPKTGKKNEMQTHKELRKVISIFLTQGKNKVELDIEQYRAMVDMMVRTKTLAPLIPAGLDHMAPLSANYLHMGIDLAKRLNGAMRV